jgi:hypothetical protein
MFAKGNGLLIWAMRLMLLPFSALKAAGEDVRRC